jgi:hypothetical protein
VRCWARSIATVFVLLGGCVNSRAQVGCIAVKTELTTDVIKQWLRSGNRALIAWGAYFAGESADEGVVTLMEEMLQGGSVTASQDERLRYACDVSVSGVPASRYLLDAGIKRNEIVPLLVLSGAARDILPFSDNDPGCAAGD